MKQIPLRIFTLGLVLFISACGANHQNHSSDDYLTFQAASGRPFICLVGTSFSTNRASLKDSSEMLMASGLRCEDLQKAGLILGATAIALEVTGLGLACTGVGAPVSVAIQGAGIATGILQFVIGNLPCENTTDNKKLKKQVSKLVCETVQANGITCDPNLLQLD